MGFVSPELPATGVVSYNAVLEACKDGLPEASSALLIQSPPDSLDVLRSLP